MVSRWPLTAEALVQPQACRCESCAGRSGTGTGCSRSTSFLPCQHHCTNVLYTRVSNTAVSSRTEGWGLATDTKGLFLRSGSIGEVDIHFFMFDSSACRGFSSSNSVFVRSVTYHRGCLLFFVFVLLLSEGQVGESGEPVN